MAEELLKIIANLFVKIFIEGIGFYTGEILLFLFTFGRKRIRWDYYAEEKPTRFVVLTELSVWIGFVFWVCIALVFQKHFNY